MMRLSHHRWSAWIVWLIVAGVLYRGLIPAGFMPASGEALSHGAVLVICPHGDMMGMHDHAGHGSGGASLQQCPFGAAAGPALPGAGLALAFTPGLVRFGLDWSVVPNPGADPRLQPPARGPPLVS